MLKLMSQAELLMKKSLLDSFPKDIQQKMELVCDSVLINSYATTLVTFGQ